MRDTHNDQIKNAKIELDRISSILGDIMDGKLTQCRAAKMLGVSPQNFGDLIKTNFSSYIRKNILSEGEICNMLISLETPCESLVKDILGIHTDKLVLIDCIREEDFLKVIKHSLTSPEYEVLGLRYGFGDNNPQHKKLTLEEAGEAMGLSMAWIHNTQRKALLKLRSFSILSQLLPDYGKYISALSELEAIESLNSSLDRKYQAAVSGIQWFKYREGICRAFDAMEKEFAKETLLQDIPFFPKSWVKALMGEEICTVFGLVKTELKDLVGLSKKYGLEMEALYDACASAGINIAKPLWIKETPITELGLSTRSYNCLNRAGIKTVNRVAEMSRQELMNINHLGGCCLEEICEKMIQKFNINIKSEKRGTS